MKSFVEAVDIWEELDKPETDTVVCTINTQLKKDNTLLVMGAGIAKDFAKRYDMLQSVWGQETIKMKSRESNVKYQTYPFICPFDDNGHKFNIVGIHTKLEWSKPSPLWLVEKSLLQLSTLANSLHWQRVVMVRPGCHNGGLLWSSEVAPLCSRYLDDKFVICEKFFRGKE